MAAAQQNTWGRIGRALIKDPASPKDLVVNAGTSHQNVTPVIRSKSAHSHEKGGDSNAKNENFLKSFYSSRVLLHSFTKSLVSQIRVI